MSRPRIVCVVGPTASGKTEIGVAIAEAVGGEIVSADSRQVYRGFDIGTAKPSAAERARARHHCVDLVEPDDTFDVARFRAAAAAAIADITRRGRAAIVVGGTGLYVRALLGGLCPAPPRVPAVRAVLAQLAHVDGAPTSCAACVRSKSRSRRAAGSRSGKTRTGSARRPTTRS